MFCNCRSSTEKLLKEAKKLSDMCSLGKITPGLLEGGTFTVTNLGNYGIENFTPILLFPQVGILGIGNIQLKPVERDKGVDFIPHLGLSLTVNHQAVDGAKGARFLQALSENIQRVDEM